MAAFRFGVDSFIWTEVFSEKDIWILPKAKELGFDVVDLAIAHPERCWKQNGRRDWNW